MTDDRNVSYFLGLFKGAGNFARLLSEDGLSSSSASGGRYLKKVKEQRQAGLDLRAL